MTWTTTLIRIFVRSFVFIIYSHFSSSLRCLPNAVLIHLRLLQLVHQHQLPLVGDADDTALLALGFQKFQRVEAKGALILLWRN